MNLSSLLKLVDTFVKLAETSVEEMKRLEQKDVWRKPAEDYVWQYGVHPLQAEEIEQLAEEKFRKLLERFPKRDTSPGLFSAVLDTTIKELHKKLERPALWGDVVAQFPGLNQKMATKVAYAYLLKLQNLRRKRQAHQKL
jgi:hypothetical protein